MHSVFYFPVVRGWTMSLETRGCFSRYLGKKAEDLEFNSFLGWELQVLIFAYITLKLINVELFVTQTSRLKHVVIWVIVKHFDEYNVDLQNSLEFIAPRKENQDISSYWLRWRLTLSVWVCNVTSRLWCGTQSSWWNYFSKWP